MTTDSPDFGGDALLAKYRTEPILDAFLGAAGDDSARERWAARASSGQIVLVTVALQGLAISYRKERAFTHARRWSEMSIWVARALPSGFSPRDHPLGIGRDRLIGSCLSTLAQIEKEDGAITQAHDLLLEVEKHYDDEEKRRRQEEITEQPTADRLLNIPSVRASLYEDLARSAMLIGDETQARHYHELWMKHRNEVPTSSNEIDELILKSRFFMDQGRPDAALQHLHRAVDIAERDRGQFAVARNAGHAYRSLARTYGSLGAPRIALAMLEKATSLAEERPDWGESAGNEVTAAGIVRHRPDLGDSVQHLVKALEHYSVPADRRGRDTWLASDGKLMRIVDLDGAWPVLGQAAEILEERQRLPDAATYLRLATGIAERVRNGALDDSSRIAVQDERSNVYLRLARIQLQAARETPGTGVGSGDEAWLTLEALRARTFLDAVGDHDLTPPPEVPAYLAEREAELIDRRRPLRLRPTRDAAFWHEQQAVTRDLASTWEAMVTASPAARGYVAIREARPASHTEIAGFLAERADPTTDSAVVVSMVFLDDEHLALLAVAGGDRHVRIVTAPVDRQRLAKFVGIHFGAASRVRYLATDLEDAFHGELSGVVAPLADLCEPGQTVVICPAAPLHHVPLGAVRVGQGALLERNPLALSPSASLLRSRHPARPSDEEPSYAVFGDPTGDLPEAWQEACDLAERWQVEPCMRIAATREAFMDALGTRQVVHAAAHASFDASEPLESGVRMADGVVSAREILHVRAPELDLVTLSACETGLSRAGQSEDPVGLTRALLFAGANSVVTSLWRVPDRAARDVMTEFYKNLSRGQSKAQALRGAALTARAGDPRFHCWAAFVLTGAWD